MRIKPFLEWVRLMGWCWGHRSEVLADSQVPFRGVNGIAAML